MNEFSDVKRVWSWFMRKWATSFASIVLIVIAFFFGTAWEAKQITDDCKFIGAFRDSTQAFTCQVRVR